MYFIYVILLLDASTYFMGKQYILVKLQQLEHAINLRLLYDLNFNKINEIDKKKWSYI